MNERDARAEQTIFGAILIIAVIALVVIGVEQSRKVDRLSMQIIEMRTSMEEAGYVCREPRIEAER